MTGLKYIESTVSRYLNDLSAKLPAPGGGSASAAASALGIALLSMVANFTAGKKGYEDHQERISEILAELEKTRKRLEDFVDLDVEAYSKVSAVFKIPKEDPDRTQKVQQGLKEAMSVPWEILELSAGSVKFAQELAKIGNKNLISDVGCGVLILKAGVESAKLNVLINLKSITDGDFVKEKTDSMTSAINDFNILAEKTLKEIERVML